MYDFNFSSLVTVVSTRMSVHNIQYNKFSFHDNVNNAKRATCLIVLTKVATFHTKLKFCGVPL